MWESKWITLTGPQWLFVDLRADSVVVWSPPSVIIRGTVKSLELVLLAETTFTLLLVSSLTRRTVSLALCALSSCFKATVLSLRKSQLECFQFLTFDLRGRPTERLHNLQFSPNRQAGSVLGAISPLFCAQCLGRICNSELNSSIFKFRIRAELAVNQAQHVVHVVLQALNIGPIVEPCATASQQSGKRCTADLPVYTLQPAPAAIRCEPRRIPFGPNRAPGRAVTPCRRQCVPRPWLELSVLRCHVYIE